MSSIISFVSRGLLSGAVCACLACGSDGGPSGPNPPPPPPPPPPPAAPVLTGIDADTLVPGADVTLRGENFVSAPADNDVRISGERATVTSASDTLLVATVPGTACLPPHAATVSVAVGSETSNELSAPFDPGDPFTPAVGELVLFGSGRPCVQLPATSTAESYLIGVQRVSSAASSRSAIRISAVLSTTASSAALRGPGDRVGSMTTPHGFVAGHEGHSAHDDGVRTTLSPRSVRAWHSTPAPGGHGRTATALHRRFSTSARQPVALPTRAISAIDSTVAQGDTVSIRSVTPVSANCSDWDPVQAVVRRVGGRAIWIEDLSNAPGSFSDAEIQAMSDEFDDVIYEVDTDWFGEPGDSDGNGRVVIVLSGKVNEINPGLGGFVVGCDLFPRASVSGSNEGEYLWLGPPDPGGAYGPPTSSEGTMAFLRRVVAHELVHVIQFTRRLGSNGIIPMGIFIDEGQPTLAEEIVGNAFLGIEPQSNAGYSVAFNSPSMTPTGWYASTFSDLSRYFGSTAADTRVAEAPHSCSWLDANQSPCPTGRPLFYAVGWSLLRWISDHLAPDLGGEQAVQRALIDTPTTGFQLLADVTGMPTDSMLAQWAAALYLDDRFAGLPDRLTIPSWDFLNVFEGPQQPKSTAGLSPAALGFTDFDTNASVVAGSMAYYVVGGTAREALAVQVASQTGGNLPPATQLIVVRVE